MTQELSTEKPLKPSDLPKRNCQICQGAFQPVQFRHKYCSIECKKKADYYSYYARNKDKLLARSRLRNKSPSVRRRKTFYMQKYRAKLKRLKEKRQQLTILKVRTMIDAMVSTSTNR